MINLQTLTEEQARAAMGEGEFDETVTTASPNVAVVLTQSWCPQWIFMKSYLHKLKKSDIEENENLTVFILEYNRVPWFEEFLRLKERIFQNELVPYVRYYRHGKLFETSNYVSKPGFLAVFSH